MRWCWIPSRSHQTLSCVSPCRPVLAKGTPLSVNGCWPSILAEDALVAALTPEQWARLAARLKTVEERVWIRE